MSSIRSRFSAPVQIFILILYFLLVLLIKNIYDNNQRSQRFEKYNIMLTKVAETLEVVERHAKETAQAVKSIEVFKQHYEDASLKEQSNMLRSKSP